MKEKNTSNTTENGVVNTLRMGLKSSTPECNQKIVYA
jgi:hypothetical protein